jgi:hypothetical protein
VFASAFHAWLNYAASHEWHAAGVEVRRVGVDVMKNTGSARQDLRDFVRGPRPAMQASSTADQVSRPMRCCSQGKPRHQAAVRYG